MASRKIEDLEIGIQVRAKTLIHRCEGRGADLLIYCTYRSFEEQAKLYRQSRPMSTIVKKCQKLNDAGFPELANVIWNVGPQMGVNFKHVTFAGPGESWHQYRQAFDGVPLVGGKAAWDVEQFKSLWDIYGGEAEKLGFHWAGRWTKFKEYPHCQAIHGSNPLKILDRETIIQALMDSGSPWNPAHTGF